MEDVKVGEYQQNTYIEEFKFTNFKESSFELNFVSSSVDFEYCDLNFTAVE